VVPTTALARDYRRAFVCSDAGKMAAKNLSARKKCPLSPDEIGRAIGKYFKLR